MSKIKQLIAGLKNTQAPEVHVPYDIVEEIVGYEIAEELVVQRVSLASKKPASPILAKAVKDLEEEQPASARLGTFNRADLLEVIEELIEEQGGIDAFVEVKNEESTLQKIRRKLGHNSYEDF